MSKSQLKQMEDENKKFVLSKCPDAYAYKSIIFHTWSISANGTFLCSVAGFNTETLAWADAVKRIKEKQND